MKGCWAIALSVWAVLTAAALAQTQQRSQVAGTITAIDAPASQLSLKTDKGDSVAVTTTERTVIVHVPAGETDVSKGTRMTLANLEPGDRVVAVYRGPGGQSAVQATSLVVRTKADLAAIAAQDREDWQKRGTTGTVTAVDPTSKAITLKAGQRTVVVEPSEKTEYHRYSLDSAKFSDSKLSSFEEIKVGDQLRVLGNKSADGASVVAEKIASGTFRQIAATIVSVNAATGEMQVKDLATKKPLTIRVNADSTMKKLEPQMAAGLARRFGPGREQGQGAGDGGRAGRGAGGDIGSMLDRLPAAPLTDLKAGDAVMVSTTMGSDPTRVTVITLLAGVEPLLAAAPNSTRDIMSGWNLGGGGGAEGN